MKHGQFLRLWLRLLLGGGVVLLISHHHHGAGAVLHAVIADAAELPFAPPPGGADAAAAHDDGAQSQPLNLQAQPLLHVVILHDVNLHRDMGVHERLRQVVGLLRRQVVVLLLHLPRRRRRRLGEGVVGGGGAVGGGGGGGAPVGAVENAGGPDMEEDHGVAGADVVVHRPLHGEGALVAEVDGDGDAAEGGGGGGVDGVWGDGRRREARGGCVDLDGLDVEFGVVVFGGGGGCGGGEWRRSHDGVCCGEWETVLRDGGGGREREVRKNETNKSEDEGEVVVSPLLI